MEATNETRIDVLGGPVILNLSPSRRIGVIAINAFKESVRDRVLYNLILFALLLVGASVFISELSVNQENRFMLDLGLSSILVFGAMIAIFIGVGLVYKEIDKRTIYYLLSKPVKRYEFIIGKYLGLCMTLLVNCTVMAAGTILALLYVGGGFGRLQLTCLPAALLIYFELTILVAVALTFSTFTTPILSALFSFAVYVIGNYSDDIRVAGGLARSASLRHLLTVLYYAVPNLSRFGFIGRASHGQAPTPGVLLSAAAYAIVYVSLLLAVSILIFDRRNLK
ncbi:MAG TPA: ABC transporter permease [Blastocatellia bacterium]|nr:ABC transporter permease [Blastocatellia bacterium]